MPLEAKVSGAKELRRALRKVGADMKDLSKIHRDISRFLAIDAARRAPVYSGDLEASIRGTATTTRARIQSDVVYAPVIHWGWGRRNIRANPFAYEAIGANQSEILSYYVWSIAETARRAGFRTR